MKENNERNLDGQKPAIDPVRKSTLGSVAGYYVPLINVSASFRVPFTILLHGTEDVYMPIFGDRRNYNELVAVWIEKFANDIKVTCGVVKNHEHVDLLLLQTEELAKRAERLTGNPAPNFYAMIDPEIVNEHHTRWTQRVRQGDIWKFCPASNH